MLRKASNQKRTTHKFYLLPSAVGKVWGLWPIPVIPLGVQVTLISGKSWVRSTFLNSTRPSACKQYFHYSPWHYNLMVTKIAINPYFNIILKALNGMEFHSPKGFSDPSVRFFTLRKFTFGYSPIFFWPPSFPPYYLLVISLNNTQKIPCISCIILNLK